MANTIVRCRISILTALFVLAARTESLFAGDETPPKTPPIAALADIDRLWADLADADAAKAYRAICEIEKSPSAAVSYFAKHQKPAAAPARAEVERLLTGLGSGDFAVREKSNLELGKLGTLVEPALRAKLETNPTLEIRRRVESLLGKLAGPITLAEELRQTRVVEVLEHVGTQEAKALLAQYAAGAPASRLSQEAGEALKRLAKSPARVAASKRQETDLYDDPLPRGAIGRLGTIRFRRDFEGSFGEVSGFAFLPDGKSVLAAGSEHQVQVWDVNTGHRTHQLQLGTVRGYSRNGFTLSPDAKYMAIPISHPTLGDEPGAQATHLFAFPSGELVRSFPRSDKRGDWAFAFSPDSKLLFSFNSREGMLHVEEIATGNELAQKRFPRDGGGGLAVSSDGQFVALATGVNSRKLFLWKWREKEEPRELPLKGYGLDQISLSPDGKLLAGVDNLSRLLVWELPAGRMLYHQETAEKGFRFRRKPVFTPDGKIMAVVLSSNQLVHGGKVELLDPATGRLQGTLESGSAIAFSPDSRTAAVTAGTGIRLFDVASRTELRPRGECHDTAPSQLVAAPNGTLVSSGDDGSIRIWDAETTKARTKWMAGNWVRGLALSPDGRYLAASSLDDVVHVWDVPGDKKLYQLAGHGRVGGCRTLGFSPDSRSLISFGDDFNLRIWDMKTGRARFEHLLRPDGIKLPEDEEDRARFKFHISGGVITPDGKTFVLDMNGQTYLFDTTNGKQFAKFPSEGRFSSSMAASPDSKFLLTSAFGDYRSGKHVLSLIELSSGTAVQRSHLPGSRSGPVSFSPDGRMFATVVEEPKEQIHLYERATGQVRGVIRGLRGDVHALTFFPDNRRLASSQADATVMIWDLASVQPLEKTP